MFILTIPTTQPKYLQSIPVGLNTNHISVRQQLNIKSSDSKTPRCCSCARRHPVCTLQTDQNCPLDCQCRPSLQSIIFFKYFLFNLARRASVFSAAYVRRSLQLLHSGPSFSKYQSHKAILATTTTTTKILKKKTKKQLQQNKNNNVYQKLTQHDQAIQISKYATTEILIQKTYSEDFKKKNT